MLATCTITYMHHQIISIELAVSCSDSLQQHYATTTNYYFLRYVLQATSFGVIFQFLWYMVMWTNKHIPISMQHVVGPPFPSPECSFSQHIINYITQQTSQNAVVGVHQVYRSLFGCCVNSYISKLLTPDLTLHRLNLNGICLAVTVEL